MRDMAVTASATAQRDVCIKSRKVPFRWQSLGTNCRDMRDLKKAACRLHAMSAQSNLSFDPIHLSAVLPYTHDSDPLALTSVSPCLPGVQPGTPGTGYARARQRQGRSLRSVQSREHSVRARDPPPPLECRIGYGFRTRACVADPSARALQGCLLLDPSSRSSHDSGRIADIARRALALPFRSKPDAVASTQLPRPRRG
jgi:hypothetical protein